MAKTNDSGITAGEIVQVMRGWAEVLNKVRTGAPSEVIPMESRLEVLEINIKDYCESVVRRILGSASLKV